MYILIYIIAVVFIVLLVSRNLSQEGFLLADRAVPPWFAAMSLVVSKFGGGKILAGGSLIYLFGWSAMWFNAGFALGYILFAKLAFRLKNLADKHCFYTLTDYYKTTAGKSVIWPVGLLCFYTMLGFTCINIVGGAHILTKLSGFDYNASVTLVSLFVGAYILIGGFKSVIATDVLQAIVIIAGLLLFVFFVNLPPNMSEGLEHFFSDFGSIPIVYTFFMGFFFSFGMPEVWPRIYAVRNINDLKLTIPITVIVYITLGVLLALLILAFRADLPNMEPATAILSGFQSLLPPSLSGVIGVFLFAAIMSSADTYLFQTNTALEQDLKFWDRLLPKSKSTQYKMRWSIVCILVLCLCIALYLPDIVKVVLLFSAGNFILGVLGLISRFTVLSSKHVWFGSMFGLVCLLASLLHADGLGFHTPLAAMIGTAIGIGLASILSCFDH